MLFHFIALAIFFRQGTLYHLSVEIEINVTENDINPRLEWFLFQQKYNKNYEEREKQFRFEIFKTNYAMIQEHNRCFSQNQVSYSMAVNEFADKMDEEVNNLYKGLKLNTRNQLENEDMFDLFDADVPQEIDWRTKNVVTPVKNQLACESCYAFSATGSMEGQYAIRTNTLISLSEQNIIDCSTAFLNFGCHGGNMNNVFQYVQKNGGIDTEKQYPYEAKQGKCRYKKNPFIVTGFKQITKSNETALKIALATVGPISVAVDITHSFMLYNGGVFTDNSCSNKWDKLNHGVLVVGYGREKGQDYWLVKNSFGTAWGEKGYIKMARNADNQCGIATMGSYPLV